MQFSRISPLISRLLSSQNSSCVQHDTKWHIRTIIRLNLFVCWFHLDGKGEMEGEKFRPEGKEKNKKAQLESFRVTEAQTM